MILFLAEDVINEAVSASEVVKALDDRKAVLINYADEEASHPGKRYIEPYVYGLTKAGNPCIRAYQYWGDTKRGTPKWKLFRLDRVESWEPTDNTFELEPKARGWAAEAYNNNGDGSMSAVYKMVSLGEEPKTEYERLRARTRELMNRKTPININNINKKNSGPIGNTNKKSNPPIENTENNEQGPVDSTNAQIASQDSIENSNRTQGPITGDTTNPQDVSVGDLMSNDDFKKMLQRNLEITNKEKQRRFGKNGEYSGGSSANQNSQETNSMRGPITGDATNPQDASAEELMSSDNFKKMLQRNLEITNKEKQRRFDKKAKNSLV